MKNDGWIYIKYIFYMCVCMRHSEVDGWVKKQKYVFIYLYICVYIGVCISINKYITHSRDQNEEKVYTFD